MKRASEEALFVLLHINLVFFLLKHPKLTDEVV